MQIDRTRFLVLTTAIAAAAACTANSTTTNNPPPPTDGGTSADVTATPVDSGHGGTDGSVVDGSATDSSEAAAPACDNLGAGDLSACAVYSDAGAGDAGAADGGSDCLTEFVCSGASANLKPEIAALVVNCVAAQTTCNVGDCIKTAAQVAYGSTGGPSAGDAGYSGECTDTTAQATCDQINTACGDAGMDAGVTNADCLLVAGRMTTTGRTAFVACMTGGGCLVAPSVEGCLASLF
jgi:hypothetical protein